MRGRLDPCSGDQCPLTRLVSRPACHAGETDSISVVGATGRPLGGVWSPKPRLLGSIPSRPAKTGSCRRLLTRFACAPTGSVTRRLHQGLVSKATIAAGSRDARERYPTGPPSERTPEVGDRHGAPVLAGSTPVAQTMGSCRRLRFSLAPRTSGGGTRRVHQRRHSSKAEHSLGTGAGSVRFRVAALMRVSPQW